MKEKWDHVNVSPVLKHLVSTMFINLISFYFTIQPSPVLCSLLAVTTMEQWSTVTFFPSPPPAERSCGRVLVWLKNQVIQGNGLQGLILNCQSGAVNLLSTLIYVASHTQWVIQEPCTQRIVVSNFPASWAAISEPLCPDQRNASQICLFSLVYKKISLPL